MTGGYPSHRVSNLYNISILWYMPSWTMYRDFDLNAVSYFFNITHRSEDFLIPHDSLTHRDLNKMASILQTKFSNAICWMKIMIFWFKFLQIFSPRAQSTIKKNTVLNHILAWAWQATSHYLHKWWPNLLTHIYASLSIDELKWWSMSYLSSSINMGQLSLESCHC